MRKAEKATPSFVELNILPVLPCVPPSSSSMLTVSLLRHLENRTYLSSLPLTPSSPFPLPLLPSHGRHSSIPPSSPIHLRQQPCLLAPWTHGRLPLGPLSSTPRYGHGHRMQRRSDTSHEHQPSPGRSRQRCLGSGMDGRGDGNEVDRKA